MGRPNNGAGCAKSGKLINGQGAIRAGRVSNFSEINKRACPFIRQVRVITIFHLFELLNAENIFLYICLSKVLRNNALCFSCHSQLSVVSKTLNKQFRYIGWVFPKFKIILLLNIVCYLRHLVSILKLMHIHVRVCCCLHSLMVVLQGVLVVSSCSSLLLVF